MAIPVHTKLHNSCTAGINAKLTVAMSLWEISSHDPVSWYKIPRYGPVWSWF